jgi:hypothetical protein
MLSGGLDQLYRSVLAAAHQHYVRVEVWSGGGVKLGILQQYTGALEGGLTFLAGAMSASLNSRVSRNLSMEVPPDLYPRTEADLLAPFGNELRVFRGVRLGDGSTPYVWQVFRGRIRDVAKSSRSCMVTAADRANDVVDVGFVSPMNSDPANTVNAEFVRLVSDALSDATFGTSDTFGKTMEPLTWEFDRGSALDEMARSVGAVWYPLADGSFVIRRFPWAVATDPLLTLTDATGGTVLDWTARRSRDSIFNVLTVTGERLNGDPPVHATAQDDVPGSPTDINGNFGVRSRLERLQTPSTQGGAQSAAEALLRTYVAPTEEWTLQMVPDAALELGDVVTLALDGRLVTQVVTGFTLPLDLSGSMTVSTRSLVVGGV